MAKKDLLVLYEGMLYELGVEQDKARANLALLVDRGVSYNTAMMHLAYDDYRQVTDAFAELEKQYSALRNELLEK